MIKHYIKVAIRLIKRSFLFSSINMLGFVLGMTAAFLIYLWIVDELTFEDFQPACRQLPWRYRRPERRWGNERISLHGGPVE